MLLRGVDVLPRGVGVLPRGVGVLLMGVAGCVAEGSVCVAKGSGCVAEDVGVLKNFNWNLSAVYTNTNKLTQFSCYCLVSKLCPSRGMSGSGCLM